MKLVEVENVEGLNIFVKKIPWTTKNWKKKKTPFSAINAIFAYFVIKKFLNSFTIKSRDSEVFKYV